MRMLSSLGRIDQTRMRTGDMHDDDWPRFTSAVSQLKDKALPFTLNLAFKKANVEKAEVIDAVRELLRRLESEG